jgi:uncharacterized protein
MTARLALLLAWAAVAGATDFAALQPRGYVSDFAGVIDAASKSELERYAAGVEKATGAQFAFVTLRSLEGQPIEDVANLLFRRWGVGLKGKNEGVLILLAIGERRSRVEVGYGLEPYLTDGSAGTLLRDMRPALREGAYGTAFSVAAQKIGDRIAKAKGVKLSEPAPRQARPTSDSGFPWEVPILIAIGGIVFFATRRRRRRRGGLPAMFLDSGPFAHSGGGFGSYDSGDSFGGFGGGDSGGGGASSDW